MGCPGVEAGSGGLRECDGGESVDGWEDTRGGALAAGTVGGMDPGAWAVMVRLEGDRVGLAIGRMVGGLRFCEGSVAARLQGRDVSGRVLSGHYGFPMDVEVDGGNGNCLDASRPTSGICNSGYSQAQRSLRSSFSMSLGQLQSTLRA